MCNKWSTSNACHSFRSMHYSCPHQITVSIYTQQDTPALLCGNLTTVHLPEHLCLGAQRNESPSLGTCTGVHLVFPLPLGGSTLKPDTHCSPPHTELHPSVAPFPSISPLLHKFFLGKLPNSLPPQTNLQFMVCLWGTQTKYPYINYRKMLWTEYLCPFKSICWRLRAQDDGIRRWGLWVVIRSWGWNPHEWNSCPYQKQQERDYFALKHVKIQWQGSHTNTRKRVLTRYNICQHINLEVFSLQNMKNKCEVTHSVVLLQEPKLTMPKNKTSRRSWKIQIGKVSPDEGDEWHRVAEP
jgi:hypothetical protein